MKKALVLALALILAGAIFATQFSVGMGFVFNRDRQTKDFDIQFFGRFQAGWPIFGGPILGVIADIPAFGVTLKNFEFYTLDPSQVNFGLYTEIRLKDFSPTLPSIFLKATLMTELQSVLNMKIEYLPIVSHIGAGYTIGDFSIETGSTIINVGFNIGNKLARHTTFFPHFHLIGRYDFSF